MLSPEKHFKVIEEKGEHCSPFFLNINYWLSAMLRS